MKENDEDGLATKIGINSSYNEGPARQVKKKNKPDNKKDEKSARNKDWVRAYFGTRCKSFVQ